MSIRERAMGFVRKLRGRTNDYGEIAENSETTIEEETPVSEGGSIEGASHYAQWYEIDIERYSFEDDAMRALGFTGRAYQDGRLVYTGMTGNCAVAVFLDHLYPLKPPTLYIISGGACVPKELLNNDGSVDIFSGEHHWDPNGMTASIVVSWIEEILVLCRLDETES
ncbi:MAG: hypothetical protein JRJ85_13100 [Deltaproteobacteria bacterium]|nr:hypothetical protein [Deltaproteobacteria bacterium]